MQGISKEKIEAVKRRLEELGVQDEELVEKFVLGSGSGGQKINKTSSCVYLKHLTTGIEIKCQKGRSREMNRLLARRELIARLEEKLFEEKSARQKAIEKLRRQKRKRSKRAQEKVLDAKKRRGELKSGRIKISGQSE